MTCHVDAEGKHQQQTAVEPAGEGSTEGAPVATTKPPANRSRPVGGRTPVPMTKLPRNSVQRLNRDLVPSSAVKCPPLLCRNAACGAPTGGLGFAFLNDLP